MAKPSKYQYYPAATVRDVMDGSTFQLGMTSETLDVEISGMTHPFYTGNEALVDTAGRIDRFEARLAAKSSVQKVKKTKARKQRISLGDLVQKDEETKPIKKAKKTSVPVEISAQDNLQNDNEVSGTASETTDSKAE